MLRKGGDGGRKLTGLWRGQGCGPGQRQKIGAILFFFNIFYFWPHQLLVIARGIFRCDAQALQCREQPPGCSGSAAQGAASVVVVRKLCSGGTWA